MCSRFRFATREGLSSFPLLGGRGGLGFGGGRVDVEEHVLCGLPQRDYVIAHHPTPGTVFSLAPSAKTRRGYSHSDLRGFVRIGIWVIHRPAH
jgi:hypothetical protein